MHLPRPRLHRLFRCLCGAAFSAAESGGYSPALRFQ
uniref:Uncharacterized protein n=1 Tax=Arundo donax TaxID=35708 RepID=A0A0A8Z6T5_ARUDO